MAVVKVPEIYCRVGKSLVGDLRSPRMVVRTNQAVRSNLVLTDNPDKVGPSLAQIIQVEGSTEVILGQAWLAAPDRLVTCGHVVDRFIQTPHQLTVRFPASQHSYVVQNIRLHPSFVRQPDGLVKFDVAVLQVALQPPESNAQPLPFSYEHSLKTNQSIATIRYPVHLNQLSAALQPLTQEGRFLGLLRKHDSFHLLHDLPLAPGDSGAPICDGNLVVAVHCGDTATLPGLNLPTTSIRLALWVDALRELGLHETKAGYGGSKFNPFVIGGISLVLAALIGFFVASNVIPPAKPNASPQWAIEPPKMAPLQVRFERAPDQYRLDDEIEIRVLPGSKSHLFAFITIGHNVVCQLYPPYTTKYDNQVRPANEAVLIDKIGTETLLTGAVENDIHVVAVHPDVPKADDMGLLVDRSAWIKDSKTANGVGLALAMKPAALVQRIKELQQKYPDQVIYWSGPGPVANNQPKDQ